MLDEGHHVRILKLRADYYSVVRTNLHLAEKRAFTSSIAG
jgi:hypothetical protein